MRLHAVHAASALLLLAAPAAATPRLELRWQASPGCIGQAALARTVEGTLAQPVFHGTRDVAAIVDGSVVHDGGGWRAKVVLRALTGAVLAEREISTPSNDCARLDDSLAVVVAMMVDGLREAPTPLRVAPAPPRPVRRAEHHTPFEAELEAGAAIAVGLLPEPSPGAWVRVDAVFGRRWSIGLAGAGWAASNAIALGSGARISAWTGELTACGAVVDGARASLRACAAVGAGFTDATPIALAGGAETRLPMVFDGLVVDGTLRICGPVWAHLRAGVWNPVLVPSYYFYGADRSRHDLPGPWVLEPVVSLGLGARFGS